MRKLSLYLAVVTFLFSVSTPVFSSTIPVANGPVIPADVFYKKVSSMKVKDFQKMVGRKLTLKEKVSFLIVKNKIKNRAKTSEDPGQSAFVMGLVALGLLVIGLFVPYVILGSLVAAVLAIVMGSMAMKKDGDSRKAKGGKLLGWITLSLIAFLFILAAIVISSWW